jgi:acyl-CoA thioesterase
MAQDTGPHQFQMESWISCAPFERLLHIEIVAAADGRATLRMPFLVDFAQGAGLMHGGALVSLADTAVVMAIKSILPPQTHFVTTALEARFLRPVLQGIVTAEARVVSQEGRTLQGLATVYDEVGAPVFEFSSTFKIAKGARIQGVVFSSQT